jgi:hypothetical protein
MAPKVRGIDTPISLCSSDQNFARLKLQKAKSLKAKKIRRVR